MEVEEDSCNVVKETDSCDSEEKNSSANVQSNLSPVSCDLNSENMASVPEVGTSGKNEQVGEENKEEQSVMETEPLHKVEIKSGKKQSDKSDHIGELPAARSLESSEATTSQENSPTSSNENESSTSPSDQSTAKRSISKGQLNGDSGISMERSVNSSDEDSSKRQRMSETLCEMKRAFNDNADSGSSKFHKLKSKLKKRNYRNKKSSVTSDNADTQAEAHLDDSGVQILQGGTEDTVQSANIEENGSTSAQRTEDQDERLEANSDVGEQYAGGEDDSNEWTTASEDELEEEEDTPCLNKEKPKPNWFIVSELISREIGRNQLLPERFYGSLHAVERLELMCKLDEHQGCVNALNFNQRGNLLASGSDDLAVVIWDWAIGKKKQSFDSGHRSNLFQVRWLPLNVENLIATCARDGQVRLMDTVRGKSRKLATHHGAIHKLAVHPETPHVIISAGEDAKVLSIDIRESKPTKLLVVKDGQTEVQLYSVHSNPLNSNEFCVAGRAQTVRIYDRRKVSTPLYKLCPDHITNNRHAHVTCAVYNYNGTEVLVSYNDEDIYLFDTMMPQTGEYAHRYQGHRNSATVKGVNFFGPKSEYIVSGSDCGNVFIWDKNTEAIVQWMAADEQGVVNCLEPHPHIPVLATSGLDFDVKIWVPSCEQPPAMTNLESCVRANALNRKHDSTSDPDAFDGQMLWILLRHIRHSERVRNFVSGRGSGDLNNGDEEADDSSNDNDSSDHSDSQSEGESIARLQCPPS